MLPLLVLCIVFTFTFPTVVAQVSPSQGFEYRLEIACPGEPSTCPVRATDAQDAMGDPTLAVDPFRPSNMIIATLHGAGDNPDAPSPKSRSKAPFSTFTTTDGGATWWDNPFYTPSQVRSNGFAYGEHPTLAISPYGQAFIGSLYSVPTGTGGFDYVLGAQKFRHLQDININQDGAYQTEYLTTYYPGNAIEQTWNIYNPHTEKLSIVWHEKVTEHSRAGGQLPVSAKTMKEAVQALRGAGGVAETFDLTVAGEPFRGSGQDGARSIIAVAWTDVGMDSGYSFSGRNQAIGPCDASTNPVIRDGFLYVGCKVGQGHFPWNPSAAIGTIELFRVDPDGGEPQHIGSSPLSGGAPKIGVRSDGRMALITSDVSATGRLILQAVYGGLNEETGFMEWGPVIDYAPDVEAIAGAKVVGANIQDMIYREYSGVIHAILKRNVEHQPDLTTPGDALGPSIHKSILALDEDHGFLYYHDLGIGNIYNRMQDPELLQQSDAVFDDIVDDFLELPPMPRHYKGENLGEYYQREFFAVADYGTVIFAEIVELTDLRGPMYLAASAPPPPAPVPAPAAVGTAAVAGALATSGVASLVAVRMHRQVAVGAKKKR